MSAQTAQLGKKAARYMSRDAEYWFLGLPQETREALYPANALKDDIRYINGLYNEIRRYPWPARLVALTFAGERDVLAERLFPLSSYSLDLKKHNTNNKRKSNMGLRQIGTFSRIDGQPQDSKERQLTIAIPPHGPIKLHAQYNENGGGNRPTLKLFWHNNEVGALWFKRRKVRGEDGNDSEQSFYTGSFVYFGAVGNEIPIGVFPSREADKPAQVVYLQPQDSSQEPTNAGEPPAGL